MQGLLKVSVQSPAGTIRWRLMAYSTQTIVTLWIVSFFMLVNATCSNDELKFEEAGYTTKDFAIIDFHKEISLCVVPSKFDTCNIQWYKDGKRLLSDDNIIFLNNGQILKIFKIGASDAGNYSCSVSNGNQQISRSLMLVTYVDYDGPPLNTQYSLCQFADTEVGADHVSATCKFYIETDPGEVVCDWNKQNTSAPKGSEEEWLPLWWTLPDNKYDDRHCSENPDLPVCEYETLSKVSMSHTLIASSVFADGKIYDAYISHTDNDTQFVLCLKRQLERKGYNVYVAAVDTIPGGGTLDQIAKALVESRRFIMVLSSSYMEANFAAYEVTQFVEQVSHYKNEIISIVFKNTKVEAENCRTILKHVLQVSRVVRWPELLYDQVTEQGPAAGTDTYRNLEEQAPNSQYMEETFKRKVYKELLLGMPPKPKVSISEQNGHVNTILTDSFRMNGDHLDNL
ncbi:Interleukin-18 receptor 1 [Holothuria leucospilota]|uniref:Interleukin-18 receptor 1 n=1 Tax=Holothuria leucospilota TaxID=206669 RepID=A0A9Q1H395_HOLLE|nr:Interleukin-18 receptor 1 [Holothuria leucospilota]